MYYHISTSIDGLLMMSNREMKRLLLCVRDDEGNIPTVEEFIKYLKEEKKKGHKLIPPPECDNFDPVKGCLGHPEKDKDG